MVINGDGTLLCENTESKLTVSTSNSSAVFAWVSDNATVTVRAPTALMLAVKFNVATLPPL